MALLLLTIACYSEEAVVSNQVRYALSINNCTEETLYADLTADPPSRPIMLGAFPAGVSKAEIMIPGSRPNRFLLHVARSLENPPQAYAFNLLRVNKLQDAKELIGLLCPSGGDMIVGSGEGFVSSTSAWSGTDQCAACEYLAMSGGS